jgi:hypothetical protein
MNDDNFANKNATQARLDTLQDIVNKLSEAIEESK